MSFTYIITGNQPTQIADIIDKTSFFSKFSYIGTFNYGTSLISEIIQLKPQLVFIVKNRIDTDLSLKIIGEAHSYLPFIPYFIVISESDIYALEAIQNGISDYLLNIDIHTLGLSLSKFEKKFSDVVSKTICIKSYSDYHFLKFEDIVYLKADNNSTDFKLKNDKIITAYKTLKHFEQTLPYNFVRIHKSYIVNVNYVSRIHFSKKKCFLNFDEQLPFTETYREKVEQIIDSNLTS